jgi:transaldolase
MVRALRRSGPAAAASRSRKAREQEAEGTMTILLDSASVDDARAAAEIGFVRGITTNPALMARETREPLAHLERLLDAFPVGPVCYQPTRTAYAEMYDEARAAASLAPDRVVAKLPATLDAIRLAAVLTDEGLRCALTAVYSPAQALLAHEVGCVWIIPYVDRAARHSDGGLAVVDSLAAILARLKSSTRILAASLKSGPQVTDAIVHGSHDVTAPLDVLRSLPAHPLTESAVRDFAAAWGEV